MISTVIISYNEAEKLDSCLKRIKDFADEIILIDLSSTDETDKIAKKYKAKIFKHELVPYVELVRNYAVSKASNEWILVLDPDEIVPNSLKNYLKEIAQKDEFEAVNIPRKNIFFGKWISHSNWWPDRHIRFFKKGKINWDEQIHKYPSILGKVATPPAKEDLAIWHYGYKTIDEFIERQNRYSSITALNLHDNGIKFSWRLFFWKPTREFLVRFIKHLGFLDGFLGLILTFLMMVYQLEVMIKLWELENQK